MIYNVRIKGFPDGMKQYMWSELGQERDYELAECPKRTGEEVGRKELDNLKRAKEVIYDLARCNKFDYFITLTFGPDVNRYDYDACCAVIKQYTNYLSKHGFRWIIVPEQHADGAWHFHGLLAGSARVVRAYSPHTGKPLFDNFGREVYNLLDYQAGFTTAVPLDGSPRIATYLTKYFSKSMTVPKGRKRYWASRNLVKPVISYDELDVDTFEELMMTARYRKDIKGPYGRFVLVET